MIRPALAPSQIVYLACEQTRLYAEVIQVLADRQLCWARPLLLLTPEHRILIHPSMALNPIDLDPSWGDTKAPDLIWPLEQFSPALDTDFLALLTAPDTQDLTQTQNPPISALLHQFMTCLWQMTTAPLTESG